jgi:hypothetical protein
MNTQEIMALIQQTQMNLNNSKTRNDIEKYNNILKSLYAQYNNNVPFNNNTLDTNIPINNSPINNILNNKKGTTAIEYITKKTNPAIENIKGLYCVHDVKEKAEVVKPATKKSETIELTIKEAIENIKGLYNKYTNNNNSIPNTPVQTFGTSAIPQQYQQYNYTDKLKTINDNNIAKYTPQKEKTNNNNKPNNIYDKIANVIKKNAGIEETKLPNELLQFMIENATTEGKDYNLSYTPTGTVADIVLSAVKGIGEGALKLADKEVSKAKKDKMINEIKDIYVKEYPNINFSSQATKSFEEYLQEPTLQREQKQQIEKEERALKQQKSLMDYESAINRIKNDDKMMNDVYTTFLNNGGLIDGSVPDKNKFIKYFKDGKITSLNTTTNTGNGDDFMQALINMYSTK